jgi:hypothetical protein
MQPLTEVLGVVVIVFTFIALVLGLITAIVWEVGVLRRVLTGNRTPSPEQEFWREQRALNVPRGSRPGGGR